MHKQLLMAQLVYAGDTQASLAREMGISLSRLNAKINQYQGADFSQSEIEFIAQRYRLSSEAVYNIFFSLCNSLYHI